MDPEPIEQPAAPAEPIECPSCHVACERVWRREPTTTPMIPGVCPGGEPMLIRVPVMRCPVCAMLYATSHTAEVITRAMTDVVERKTEPMRKRHERACDVARRLNNRAHFVGCS